MIRIFAITCLLLLLQCAPASARLNLNDRPPKALLIQLLTRQSQANYLRKHNPAKLPAFLNDVEGIMKVTVKDYATNFNYCPVYYFIDTNSEAIKKGKFDGVLLDKDMKPVHQTVLAEGDTSFFIAYYGVYLPQGESEVSGDGDENLTADDATSLKPILLVLDHKYRVLRVPRPRTVRGFAHAFYGKASGFYYHSQKFNMDYVPTAAAYATTLNHYYARIARRRMSAGYNQ